MTGTLSSPTAEMNLFDDLPDHDNGLHHLHHLGRRHARHSSDPSALSESTKRLNLNAFDPLVNPDLFLSNSNLFQDSWSNPNDYFVPDLPSKKLLFCHNPEHRPVKSFSALDLNSMAAEMSKPLEASAGHLNLKKISHNTQNSKVLNNNKRDLLSRGRSYSVPNSPATSVKNSIRNIFSKTRTSNDGGGSNGTSVPSSPTTARGFSVRKAKSTHSSPQFPGENGLAVIKKNSAILGLAIPDLNRNDIGKSSSCDQEDSGHEGVIDSPLSFAALFMQQINDNVRSSEQEPSQYQMDLPSESDFLIHARLCSVMGQYRLVDPNFDFRSLIGMTRMTMNAFVTLGASSIMRDCPATTTTTTIRSQYQHLLADSHRPIVNSIKEAGGAEDELVVEGCFFHEVVENGGGRDRREVTIFRSEKNRQLIVIYQGSEQAQCKPVRNRDIRDANSNNNNNAMSCFHPDQPNVTVFPAFRNAYFRGDMEGTVFRELDLLSERHPFFDVVMTGCSFGGVLATLGGMRYAVSRPMMRVSCHVFGSPKVGALNFRYFMNSLPNLKMMRVEYGADPWVHTPEGSTWMHAGHSIVINNSVLAALPKSPVSSFTEKAPDVPIHAYRFDKNRPGYSGLSGGASKIMNLSKMGYHTKQEKSDHELTSYVHALERVVRLGLPWPKTYFGSVTDTMKRNECDERTVV